MNHGTQLTTRQAADVLMDAHSGADVSFFLSGSEPEEMGLPEEAYFVSASGMPSETCGGRWYTIKEYREMLINELIRVQNDMNRSEDFIQRMYTTV